MQKDSNNKILRVIFCFIEILLFSICILSFFKPRNNYTLGLNDMNSMDAIMIPMPEDGWYIDNSMNIEHSSFLQTVPIDLPKGSYNISIHYQTSGGGTSISFNADNPTYRLLAGRQNMLLDDSITTKEYQLYLYENEEGFYVSFEYNGNGYAWISGVDIVQTFALERLHTFYALLIIILLELIWFAIRKNYWYKLFESDSHFKSLTTIILVIIPVMLASLPCFTYYIINGFDLNFHMLRIEGISEALKRGQFPARIQTNWLKGYGYPVSVFYGDLLLYLPAALRAIGMPLQSAYKIFVILINILTGTTMYLSAKGMTKSRPLAILASYLYLLLPYRLSCMYIRAGVGEYCAMAFFPLIIWGLYKIYTTDTTSKEWKHIWILAVIGFTGVIESHLLSTVFAGLFATVCCLLLFKKTFEKPRFIALLKTVFSTIIVNSAYFIPLLDYMQKKYKVSDISDQARIQTQGAYTSQIFSLFPKGAQFSVSITDDLHYPNEIVLSLGIIAWLGVITFLIYFIFSTRKRILNKNRICKTTEEYTVYLFLGIGIITMILSSALFPWDALTARLGKLKIIFTSIQFPWRYLSLSSVFLILGITIALNSNSLKNELMPFFELIYAAIIGLTIASAGFFISQIISDNNSVYIASNCDLNDSELMGAEYIPAGVDEMALLSLRDATVSNAALVESSTTKNGYKISIANAQDNAKVSVPRIYYKGYAAKFQNDNHYHECYADELGRVCFNIPEGYTGDILVTFCEPWYWRIAELISLIASLTIIIIFLIHPYILFDTNTSQ